MAKLRKKTQLSEDSRMEKKKAKERPDKLEMQPLNEVTTPLVTAPTAGLNGNDSVSAASNSSKEYDSKEVEELIQMKKLPPETITIHSPESGTTIF